MSQHGRQSGIVPSLSFTLISRVEVLLKAFWLWFTSWSKENRCSSWCVCFQYFEYTSHKELRHNIGKQLCLQASPYPEPVKIELCTLRGKGSSLTPEQEWVFTEVSVLSEQNWSFFVFAVSICYQILRPSPFTYCLLQSFLAGELDQALMSCRQKCCI